DSTIAVDYFGQVRQSTGEDWPVVPVTLSTARPAVAQGVPELDPWYVDVVRPAAPPMARAAAAPPSMAAPAPPAAAPQPVEVAEVAEATVDSSGAAITFTAARPLAVPSDGAPHRTLLTGVGLAADLAYIT